MVARLCRHMHRAVSAYNVPTLPVWTEELQAELGPPKWLSRLERRVCREIPNNRGVTGLRFRLLAGSVLHPLRSGRRRSEQ